MKKIILIILLITFVNTVKAQKYKIEYQLIYSPDTTKIKKTKSELFTLFIVDSLSRFVSNKKLLKDSIAFEAKFDKNLALKLLANQDKIPKSDFKFDIFKIDNSQILVYEDIFFDKYLYEEKLEEIYNWEIKEEVLMIKSIECQKVDIYLVASVLEEKGWNLVQFIVHARLGYDVVTGYLIALTFYSSQGRSLRSCLCVWASKQFTLWCLDFPRLA